VPMLTQAEASRVPRLLSCADSSMTTR
jgi:hypothetical protein